MSREIDTKKIKDRTLSKAEVIYLHVRGRLPKDYPLPRSAVRSQSTPTIGNRGGIVNDEFESDEDSEDSEVEDYDDGWTNKSRIAELSTRGLSIEGKKDELISRLRRSDSGQLKKSDSPASDDDDSDEEDVSEEDDVEEEDED